MSEILRMLMISSHLEDIFLIIVDTGQIQEDSYMELGIILRIVDRASNG